MDYQAFWTAIGTTDAGKNAVWFNIPLTLLGSFPGSCSNRRNASLTGGQP